MITETLLQRTRAESVAAIFDEFFQRFPTPDALAAATSDEITQAIYPLGLSWRAKYISQLATELVALGAQLPDKSRVLQKLPGIGPYVAGAMQVLHRNKSDIFVNTNVIRLLGRYFGFEWDGETRRKKWFLGFVHRLFTHDYEPACFGYALLDFTREVCAPSPACEICPLRQQCAYFAAITS